MNTSLAMNDLAVALRALRLLAVDFPDLPVPAVDVSPIYPERLTLSFHTTYFTGESFAAFERWRTALGIDAGAVDFGVQSEYRTGVLKAEVRFGGALVVLTAYADLPDTDRVPAGRSGGAR